MFSFNLIEQQTLLLFPIALHYTISRLFPLKKKNPYIHSCRRRLH